MKELDNRLIDAWQLASAELCIQFESPFQAEKTMGGQILVEGFLPDFGSPQGMAIVSFSRRIKLASLRMPMTILPKESRKYIRKHFIAELKDWGWYGADPKPDWLNGK